MVVGLPAPVPDQFRKAEVIRTLRYVLRNVSRRVSVRFSGADIDFKPAHDLNP